MCINLTSTELKLLVLLLLGRAHHLLHVLLQSLKHSKDAIILLLLFLVLLFFFRLLRFEISSFLFTLLVTLLLGVLLHVVDV